MKTIIFNLISLFFLAFILILTGCGSSDSTTSGAGSEPIDITINSPEFDEISSMYSEVDVSLKFSDQGKVTEL